ncbi:hypothetical protein J6590_094268 [Homalodisca vitripennis]|nr:hypothetical protein J6590_064186 [Homalodisca vitripennis]KAG8294817.1 hypothetical protein J6590_094268 [Homalodisca vitripennis]
MRDAYVALRMGETETWAGVVAGRRKHRWVCGRKPTEPSGSSCGWLPEETKRGVDDRIHSSSYGVRGSGRLMMAVVRERNPTPDSGEIPLFLMDEDPRPDAPGHHKTKNVSSEVKSGVLMLRNATEVHDIYCCSEAEDVKAAIEKEVGANAREGRLSLSRPNSREQRRLSVLSLVLWTPVLSG